MTTEHFILLNNVEEPSSTFSFGPKFKGAGYHSKIDTLHTVIFELDRFVGRIKIQGTLEEYPGDNSWVDIRFEPVLSYLEPTHSQYFDSTFDSTTDSIMADEIGDSVVTIQPDDSPITQYRIRHFVGSWVWIRAAYQIDEGIIGRVRMSF